MASPVSALNGSSTTTNPTTTSSAAAAAAASAPTESMFLTLLVSQMKNQDPLNPTDSTQFVSQLAQFSELEQVMAIRSDTDQLSTAATAASQTSAASTTPTTSSPTTPGPTTPATT
jgi:flagellar basal-body rod modification protein FlgD